MVESKSFRNVEGFGTGTLVMVHDRDSQVYRIEMDGSDYVFQEFEYGLDNSANTRMDEARTRAQLTLDNVATTLKAVKRGEI